MNRQHLVTAGVGAACLMGGFASGMYAYARNKKVPYVGRRHKFSIGIYRGSDPFSLAPHPEADNPVLTAEHVTDGRALFVADPFLLKTEGGWQMFFEVMRADPEIGRIGVAHSQDGLRWSYDRVVLEESFHLSYPYVFEWDGEYYMVPESAKSYSIRLYKAEQFPWRWSCVKEILHGGFRDASIFRRGGSWWLYAVDGDNVLRLYQADSPVDNWREHPRSPIVLGDASRARPGGRATPYKGSTVRYAQDGGTLYGSTVRAFLIDTLNSDEFEEHEVEQSPVLRGSGVGWNARGMHHLDPVQIGPGEWLAAVDGFKTLYGFRR